MEIKWDDIKDLDIQFQVSDLNREVTMTVRALNDRTFKALAKASEVIKQEITDLKKLSNP
jgi:hypothetical protein